MEHITPFIAEWQTHMWDDAFWCSFTLMAATTAVLFVLSHVNDNYSWVDRSWSIVPVVYTWVHTLFASSFSPALNSRCVLFALVVTAWGVRLTFNFARRGGYKRGGEDYRWVYVRTWPLLCSSPALWTIFNFFVITFYQTWLLWAITLPTLQFTADPITVKDGVYAAVLLALISLETLCDQQQWRFQCAKQRYPQEIPYRYGFCVTGVFGYSRHLNVFCEASIWLVLAQAAGGFAELAAWQVAGSTVLALLVLFSTGVITERLSGRKYPGYAVYQQTTPMFFPTFSSTTEQTLFELRKF